MPNKFFCEEACRTSQMATCHQVNCVSLRLFPPLPSSPHYDLDIGGVTDSDPPKKFGERKLV